MIKVRIDKWYQTCALRMFGRTFYLGLWWPRGLWSRDLALIGGEFIFSLGPMSVLVY